ncbi:universal stress protein [Dyella flagellata]|uniref:Universal stress protein n=1 Tax=Dyella flagellata TaxID=1867833 RepID=A0ABQ5XCW6_9GAMM|nr:universal stress protein [Dyella flagellata]GLQ89056.1 universal stress protein [Dyella flagellata]
MSIYAIDTSPESGTAQRAVPFRRILLPIDGSQLSRNAFGVGLELAKTFGAIAVVMHVVPPYNTMAYVSEFLAAAELGYSQHAVESASRYLSEAKSKAKEAGVACECHYMFGEHPHEAILNAVTEHHCDLVVMATHGWHGVNRLLLGSETQKVLAGCPVPVLVCR